MPHGHPFEAADLLKCFGDAAALWARAETGALTSCSTGAARTAHPSGLRRCPSPPQPSRTDRGPTGDVLLNAPTPRRAARPRHRLRLPTGPLSPVISFPDVRPFTHGHCRRRRCDGRSRGTTAHGGGSADASGNGVLLGAARLASWSIGWFPSTWLNGTPIPTTGDTSDSSSRPTADGSHARSRTPNSASTSNCAARTTIVRWSRR